MHSSETELLASHRRDVRTALVLHTLLVIALIVLWLVNDRLRVFRTLEAFLSTLLFGSSPAP